MANLKLCFYSLLLLVVTRFDTANGTPLRNSTSLSAEKCAQCSVLSKALLENITQLLQNNNAELFYGFACWKDGRMIEVHNETQTVQACAPILTEGSSCPQSETQLNLTFSESECLRNIMKDLAHYATVLQHYLREPDRVYPAEVNLLKPTLEIIQNLMESCSLEAAELRQTSEENASHTWKAGTFDNRQHMCKLMKGFHVRAITIARAVSYISSGDSRN